MYKLEITLKQHTPLIHFQWYQDGATLRASEVKPKLDKFLISQIKDIENKPFFNNEYKALKYKLNIIPYQNNINFNGLNISQRIRNGITIYETESFPFLLANMGGKRNRNGLKNFVLFDKLKMSIYTYHSELKDIILNNICDFFAENNFGNRQSKGFGSFYPDTCHEKEEWYKRPSSKFYFSLTLNEISLQAYKNVFQNLELFYRALRGGLNLKRNQNKILIDLFYFKSLMFLFAKERYKALWEKRKIKEKFFNNELILQINNHPDQDILSYNSNKAYIFKDILGLSTEESWYTYHTTIKKKQAIKNINNNQETIYQIPPEENRDLERFPSPILLKPIVTQIQGKYLMTVFIILKQELLDNYLLKKSLAIYKSDDENNCIYLDFPPNFSLNEFLEFCSSKKIEEHVDEIYHNRNEYKDLLSIFINLRNNLPK